MDSKKTFLLVRDSLKMALAAGMLVLAGCGGGGGGNSASASGTPTITAHPVDQSVVVGNAATMQVAANDAIGFQWQTSTDSGNNFSDIGGATSSSYTTAATTMADNGKQYRVVVSGAANSVTSNPMTLTVSASAIAPAFTIQPLDAAITAGQNAQFVVAVSGAPTPALQWQSRANSGSSWINLNGENSASLNVAAPALADSGRQYRAVASNSAGTVNSTTATLTVTAVPGAVTPPSAPTSLAATAASSSSITLTWVDNSSDESGFKIERSDSASGPYLLLTTTTANATNYSNTGLSASTTYYYRVRATNSAGDSANTTVVSATTSAAPVAPPAAPSNLVATVTSSSSIALAWVDNSANETGFKVERATSPGGPFTLITTTQASVANYSSTGLTASTTYYYRVRATNSAGDSANTAVVSATTSAAPPVTVTLYPVNDNTIGSSSLTASLENSVWQYNYWFSTPGIGVGCSQMYGVLTQINYINCSRGLIKFDLTSLAGKTIQSATLSLTTSTSGVGNYKDQWYVAASASPWTGSSVTWINYGELTYTASISYHNPPTSVGQVFSLDQTNTVRNWVSGAYANNGFALALVQEQLRLCSCDSLDAFEFHSSEDGSGRGPKLSVTYQ